MFNYPDSPWHEFAACLNLETILDIWGNNSSYDLQLTPYFLILNTLPRESAMCLNRGTLHRILGNDPQKLVYRLSEEADSEYFSPRLDRVVQDIDHKIRPKYCCRCRLALS